MTPDTASSPHSLASASGLLFGALAVAVGVGALIGGLLGSWSIGILVGGVLGIPLGIVAVYYVYGRQDAR